MVSLNWFKRPENYARIVIRWCVLSVVMGLIGGLLGAVFHHVLHFVTHIRSGHMWLIFLLPLGGILTVLIYRHPKMKGNKGTNEIIEATLWLKAQHEGALPPPCIVRKDPRVPHTARRGA